MGLNWLRGVRTALGARGVTRLGAVFILVGIVATAIGQQELFNLSAEDSDRSVRGFTLGAVNVPVKPDALWARIPAWLPGPADQWAGGTSHSITVLFMPLAPRDLVLDIRTSRTPPVELAAFPAPPIDAHAELRVWVNGAGVA